MRTKQNKRENIRVIAIVLFILMAILVKTFSDRLQKKRDIIALKSTFKGVILKKEKMRETLITYRQIGTNKQDDFMASSDLAEHANVGDTIFKLPNSNYCMLTNKNKKLKVNCFNIAEQ